MKTFQELANDEVGTKYIDSFEDGLRLIVLRGPSALCAYIGIPKDHPLANFSYDDIPLSVHGGLTFGALGDGTYLPGEQFFYGWDYAHSGDKSFYDLTYFSHSPRVNDKAWLVDEVESELKYACWDFQKIMKLSEAIKSNDRAH